ncbi:MAG: hypothetical protein FWF34_01785 [Alphaproteobacteria bacterium]|nr:hypothetical protein [Alphaproteobacteria bacterium]MCL2889965.1 hypothetical protein [Alphaproteobacteria bacterium]
MKYVKAYAGNGTDVIYEKPCGGREIWSGGTRAWRNNNPGNIRNGAFTNARGAIGVAGGFAVFPDYDTGFAALCALLRTPNYQKLNLGDAINRYAPPIENDTGAYINFIERETGIPRNTPMMTLSPVALQKLAAAIAKHEGYRKGIIK